MRIKFDNPAFKFYMKYLSEVKCDDIVHCEC